MWADAPRAGVCVCACSTGASSVAAADACPACGRVCCLSRRVHNRPKCILQRTYSSAPQEAQRIAARQTARTGGAAATFQGQERRLRVRQRTPERTSPPSAGASSSACGGPHGLTGLPKCIAYIQCRPCRQTCFTKRIWLIFSVVYWVGPLGRSDASRASCLFGPVVGREGRGERAVSGTGGGPSATRGNGGEGRDTHPRQANSDGT